MEFVAIRRVCYRHASICVWIAYLVLSAQLRQAGASCPTTEWVDPDTPAGACFGKTDSTGAALELVFSDEFKRDGRSFADGEDPRWTAIVGIPITNSQINAYIDTPEYATTANGKLRLKADTLDYHEAGVGHTGSRAYATPMLQTWNKFCFTEGVIELSAQLPGEAKQAGLWPSFWIMGNLGRATAVKSTDRIWPFSYSHCPSAADEKANQFPRTRQEINACRPKSWTDQYGLNEGQGRGAIEIDIIEAMPGNWSYKYDSFKVDIGHCPALSAEQYTLLESPRPMTATSLQLAPGIPYGSDQRPLENNIRHGGTQGANCIPSNWSTQWYQELQQGNNNTYGTTYKSQPNVDFWGEFFNGTYPLQSDALSALNALPVEAWTGQHIYRLDWRAGNDGYVEFSYDDEVQFRVNASAALRERIITESGIPVGKMLGRRMPEEPSYIMLNIDMSTRWGWLNCDASLCDCCFDCRDPKCITCYDPLQPGVNQKQWLADLCTTLPAYYEIDYVRVWQRPDSKRTGCSPNDYPTQGWIESHRDRYVLPNMNEPLRPVLSGGYQCSSDSECGEGTCSDNKVCVCAEDWTGSQCLTKRAGASAVCKPLEDNIVGGAHCFTSRPAACGKLSNRGRCVEVARPGGSSAANLTYKIGPNKREKVGGGDGRCICSKGWGGASCSVVVASSACLFEPPGHAAMGADLETWITTTCANESDAQNRPDVKQACNEVLWKPHWEQGGGFSTCGSWLRASWVAKAVSCGDGRNMTNSNNAPLATVTTFWAIVYAISVN